MWSPTLTTEMKVTLLTIVIFTVVALATAADPECINRKQLGLSSHWPNPLSCSSYYRCTSKNSARLINCPAGKEYNSKTGKCSKAGQGICKLSLTAPLADETNICSNEVSGTFLPKENYCEHYYICQDNLAYEQACPLGDLFNTTLLACVPDTHTECWENLCIGEADGAFVKDPSSCIGYYICKDETPTAGTCESGSYFDTNACVPDSDNSHCWVNFCIGKTTGTRIASPTDCSIYYQCFNNVATERSCDDGTIFDSEENDCIIGECATTTTEQPDTTTTTESSICAGQTNGAFVEDSSSCNSYYICYNGIPTLSTCELGSYFNTDACIPDKDYKHCWVNFCIGQPTGRPVASLTDCSLFYMCSNDEAEERVCGEGYYFDSDEEECVQGECPITTTTSTTTEPCEEESTTTTEAPSTPCTDGTTKANPENCAHYYLCEHCEWKEVSCADGYYYDVDCGKCIEDKNNVCLEAATTQAPCEEGCETGTVKVDPTHCGQYYSCEDGEWQSKTCVDKSYFDPNLKACTPDDNNVCRDTDTTTEPPCEEDTTTPTIPTRDCTDEETEEKKGSCNEYYACEHCAWVEKTCADGSYFNTTLGICVVDTDGVCSQITDVQISTCNPNAMPLSADDCWHYYVCLGGSWQREACIGGQYFDSTFGVCRTDTIGICPANKVHTAVRSKRSVDEETTGCTGGIADGAMVSDTSSCYKYYICVNQELVEGSCGVGNIFNNCSGVCEPDTQSTCWVCQYRPNGYILANPDQCTSYFTCYEGLATTTSCGTGEYFNGDACVVDVTAACINPCSCGTENGNVANPICSQYYQCTNGVAQVVDCSDGEAFDTTTGLCSSSVECNATLCATAEDGTTYAISDDNTRFYLCMNNEVSVQSCGTDAIYDSDLGICMTQPSSSCDQTKCAAGSSVDGLAFAATNDDNTTFCVCLDGGAYLYSCSAGLEFDPVDAICLFTGPCDPTVCLEEDEYYVSTDYEDPDSFCLCRAQQAVSVPCPIGYTFKDGYCVVKVLPDSRCCSTYCVDKVDYTTFPAIDITTGFCVCLDEVATYYDCPTGTEYDSTEGICWNEDVDDTDGACDATKCAELDPYDPFEALNTTAGFCYCVDGSPIYSDCLDGMIFYPDEKICLASDVETGCSPCDSTACDTLPEYEPYKANNGTNGFCYCVSGSPIYSLCEEETYFVETVGICMAEEECISTYCDATKCSCLAEYEPYPSSKEGDTAGFCYCVNGEPIYDSCDDGKVFDATEKVCLLQPAPCSVCGAITTCEIEGDTFAALNGTGGFCYCTENVVIYDSCPDNSEYDPDLKLCLSSSRDLSICDSTQCSQRSEFEAFSTKDQRGTGFCLCNAITQTASYHECITGKYFNPEVGMCTLELNVCDVKECSGRKRFGPFAASNSTQGFCLCNIAKGSASYHQCEEGHDFDVDLLKCTLRVPTCDPTNCRRRARFEPFAASNTTHGFCMCNNIIGAITVTFHECAAGKTFDPVIGMCSGENEVCDPAQCNYRATFEPFSAINGTSGFCSCNKEIGTVTYHACAIGKLFSIDIGVCIEKDHMEEETHNLQKRSLEATEEENRPCRPREKRSVPLNCAKYEICRDGNWTTFSCPNWQYYNAEHGRCMEPHDDTVCNFARVPGLPSCTSRIEGQTLASKSGNCLQYFRCSQQKWRLRSCPRRQYYARHIHACLPFPATITAESICTLSQGNGTKSPCQHTTVRPSRDGCATYLMCLEDAWWYQVCPLGMYFHRELNYCVPDVGRTCAQAQTECNNNGERRAIATNCTAYEQCEGQRWVRHKCDNDTQQFDSRQRDCVPRDGSCASGGLRRACHQGERRAAPLAANCTQFYYCVDDQWLMGSCLRGHTYAGELGTCVPHAADDRCQPVWLHKLHQTYDMLLDEQVCTDKNDGQAVAHPNDCTRFYLCINGQPSLAQSCADGSFFDASISYCRPNDGSCIAPLAAACEGLAEGTLVADIDDCQAYYNCTTGAGAKQLICPTGQYFHNLTAECRADYGQCVVQVEEKESRCSDQQHGMRLSHELYCNLYYACVRGLAVPIECPDDYLFNPVLGKCVQDTEQQCQNGLAVNGNETTYSCGPLADGTYVADRIDCTRYYICIEGKAVQQKCGSSSYFGSKELLCIPDDGSCPYVDDSDDDDDEPNNQHAPPDPVVCEGRHGYILTDPNNCNNFYMCVSSKLRHERCYANYFFNSTLGQCQAYTNVTVESTLDTTNDTMMRTQKCSDSPTEFSTLCSEISEGGSIAEQGDCRRYVSCTDDEPVVQKCRNGESYDCLLSICRQNDGTCSLDTGERVGSCAGKHGQLTRDPDNCRGYFVCLHGQIIESQCEDDEYFNKTAASCQKDELQQCVSVERVASKSTLSRLLDAIVAL